MLGRMRGTRQIDPGRGQYGALLGGDGPPDCARRQPPLWQVEQILAEQQPGLRTAARVGDHLTGYEYVAETDAGRSPSRPERVP